MNNELEKLLFDYLAEQKSLDDLRDWVAMNIWDSPADEEESTIDQLALELAHLDDDSSDEQYFRKAINELLGIYSIVVDQWEGTPMTTSTTASATVDIFNTDSAIPSAPIRVGPVFA